MTRTSSHSSSERFGRGRGVVSALLLVLPLAVGCGDAGAPRVPSTGSGGSGGSTGTGGTVGMGGMSGMGGAAGVGGFGATGGSAGSTGTGGSAGTGGVGGSSGLCRTNALCHTCPDDFLCDSDDDCAFSGYVCVASGCETHGGAPIKQCQPSRAPSCTVEGDCPNASDYDCLPVAPGPARCIRVTPGCNPATESFDCAPGFSCEDGACVDRRVPCDSYLDCPKSHVCTTTSVSRYCIRTHRTCREDADCGGFAAAGSFCTDVDGDLTKECAGELGSSGEACINASCAEAKLVCESGAAPSAASCGNYGLCLDDGDCGTGFACASLWQDGRKECVPVGGACSRVTDCPPQQVCASPRNGGSPSCQAGKEAP